MTDLTAIGRRLPGPLRALLKRLMPAGVRARILRVGQVLSRENLDIAVDDSRSARWWLQVTPDTHRVRLPQSFDRDPAPAWQDGRWVLFGDATLTAAQRTELLRPMADPDIGVSVLGAVGLPDNLSAGLSIRPDAMAVRTTALGEVGGSPVGDDPLPGLLQRLRDAGRRIAVRPVGTTGDRVVRTDPIDGVGSVIILAGVPLHDVGGGSRPAQLALELLRHGFHVTYVARFDAAESTDLGLRFIHPRLEQYRFDNFDPVGMPARLVTEPVLTLIELPVAEYLPVAESLAGMGYRIVYDLLDRWSDKSLGSGWYDPENERKLAAEADALVASAPSLVWYLEQLSTRSVTEVSNGVNVALFAGDPGPIPADFPPGEGLVLGYHGSLYGDWFAWDELIAVAAAYPEARLVVIGDVREHPPLPDNVRLLGLKAQSELPSYLSRFDVGLIPFEVSETTHAVSPLKAFEYLAMGIPVAAPPLEPLLELDGVHLADRLPRAVARALGAPKPDRRAAQRAHSWEDRLTRIFGALDLDLAPLAGPEPLVVTRPAHHYPESERLL